MLDFQYYSPTRVVFGRNAVKELGGLLMDLASAHLVREGSVFLFIQK